VEQVAVEMALQMLGLRHLVLQIVVVEEGALLSLLRRAVAVVQA
jgi:hypothetical protein